MIGDKVCLPCPILARPLLATCVSNLFDKIPLKLLFGNFFLELEHEKQRLIVVLWWQRRDIMNKIGYGEKSKPMLCYRVMVRLAGLQLWLWQLRLWLCWWSGFCGGAKFVLGKRLAKQLLLTV
jgi:hypothetical protein